MQHDGIIDPPPATDTQVAHEAPFERTPIPDEDAFALDRNEPARGTLEPVAAHTVTAPSSTMRRSLLVALAVVLPAALALSACGSSAPKRIAAAPHAGPMRAAHGADALSADEIARRRAAAGERWQSRSRSASSSSASSAAGADIAPRVAAEAVMHAVAMIGTPYVWGGSRPDEGMDCSGLVGWVYAQAGRLQLPRTSRAMGRTGRAIAVGGLVPGDLVFFDTSGRNSHVGIYVGDGRFVHSPSSGGRVRIENLDAPYWLRRFDGARRLSAPQSTAPALSAAETLPRR